MVVKNAQGETPRTWTAKKIGEPKPYSGSNQATGSTSSGTGDKSFRAGGEICPEQIIARIIGGALFGGIVDQLLNDACQQLENAEACIKFYEDERNKALKRIENLQKLRQLGQEKIT
jgi:hypothetical protein